MQTDIQQFLQALSAQSMLPPAQKDYLQQLKHRGFDPKVIYDIGACVLHWTHEAQRLWPDATYVLFDAFEPAQFLYQGYLSHDGCLSDVDGRVVRFYQND